MGDMADWMYDNVLAEGDLTYCLIHKMHYDPHWGCPGCEDSITPEEKPLTNIERDCDEIAEEVSHD